MSSPPGSATVWRIAPDVVSRPVGDEMVVLDLATSHYHGVDGVGVEVWPLLADGATVDQIVAALLPLFEVEEARLRNDVEAFLSDLHAAKLVVEAV